jgi:hypothetical protein
MKKLLTITILQFLIFNICFGLSSDRESKYYNDCYGLMIKEEISQTVASEFCQCTTDKISEKFSDIELDEINVSDDAYEKIKFAHIDCQK